MDIEQLKLILEVVGEASRGAYIIAILWVLKTYFKTVAFVFILFYLIKKGLNLATSLTFISTLREIAGHDLSYNLYHGDKKDLMDLINKGKAYRKECEDQVDQPSQQ
jgi:hypothetical protein